MPRKPRKSISDISEALKEIDFLQGESFKCYNDPIWQIAADLLDGAMSKCYLYIYITQNRNNILGTLYGEDLHPIECNISKNESHESISSNWPMNESKNILPPLRTEMHISKSEWDKIDPCTVSYKNRAYEVLKPGWTDIIYEQIWKQIKIPCAFHFKNAKINHLPGDIFLQIRGKCSECNNEINIYSTNEPTTESMHLHISTYDTREIIHVKKRQLRGKTRKRVVKEITEKSTYTWRRDKANEVMEFGDMEPANLYSENVLWKAKQVHRDQELGLSGIKDPISTIVNLKYSLEFIGCIRQVGIDKFYTMYWSPEQIFMFKQFIKTDDIGSISIDATGSLVRSLPKFDGSKNFVFLYQAVAAFNGKTLFFKWFQRNMTLIC